MHDVSELEVFLEVVRHGGFSAAGRRLGLASSVVADRVTALEKRLGVRLLARTTRRQSLTEAGHLYFENGQHIAAELRALERQVGAEAASSAGTLRITAPNPLGRRCLAPFIGQFAARHPAINIHLTLSENFSDIVGEGFDIAIRGGSAIDSSLIGHRLFESRRVIVGSPAYLAQHGTPHTPQELSRHRCLVFNSAPHFQASWRLGRGEAARNIRVTAALAATNSELPVLWALDDLGLTQKSWWEVEEHIRAGRLVEVLAAHEPDPAVFYAIHPVSRSQSRKVSLFIDELRAALREAFEPPA